jgi:hypothetical protein
MLEIDVEARSTGTPERVWALLADARSWTRWAPPTKRTLKGAQGVGEIRRNRRGRITGRDRVIAGFTASSIVGAAVTTPGGKAVELFGADSPDVAPLTTRVQLGLLVDVLLLTAIVFVMATKPTFQSATHPSDFDPV